MKSLLNNFVVYYDSYDEFKHQVNQFQRAIETKEWKFFKDTILVIKSQMAQELLSKQFTDMSSGDKDVIQKTYYNINQILDYLNSPVRWFKHKNRFKEVLKPDFKGKVKPS